LAFAFFSAVRARAARVLAALRLMDFSRSTVWAELDALVGGARTLLDAAAVVSEDVEPLATTTTPVVAMPTTSAGTANRATRFCHGAC
jgi:hypothetical protein